jgi:hypothetical protein
MGINGVGARNLLDFTFKEETRWDLVKVREELDGELGEATDLMQEDQGT